jgi:hypothetical protein
MKMEASIFFLKSINFSLIFKKVWKLSSWYIGFEADTAMTKNIIILSDVTTVIWNIVSCSLVDVDTRFLWRTDSIFRVEM